MSEEETIKLTLKAFERAYKWFSGVPVFESAGVALNPRLMNYNDCCRLWNKIVEEANRRPPVSCWAIVGDDNEVESYCESMERAKGALELYIGNHPDWRIVHLVESSEGEKP